MFFGDISRDTSMFSSTVSKYFMQFEGYSIDMMLVFF